MAKVNPYAPRFRLRPEIKRRWLEALRSGRYRQGRRRLRTRLPDGPTDEFCCLGVLTDLAVQDGLGVWGSPRGDRSAHAIPFIPRAEFGHLDDDTGWETGTVPDSIVPWAFEISPNMSSADRLHLKNVTVGDESLASHNDLGASFEDIATIIEQEL